MEIGCQLPMQGPVATRDALMTFARQAEAHGMAPLWPFQIRGKQADEMLRVFKELWTSEHPTFEGEFYRVRDIGFAPKPVQKPHPRSGSAIARAPFAGWSGSATAGRDDLGRMLGLLDLVATKVRPAVAA